MIIKTLCELRHSYNKVHVFLILKIAFNLHFELTFYDNSKFVFFCFCFFFNLSEKRKLDFTNIYFAFSISVLLPAFPPLFPAFPPTFPTFLPLFLAFPPWFPAFPPHSPHSPHSHPDSQYSHPHSPHSHPDSRHSHFYSLHYQPHSRHSPRSVPRFLIPAFTDSLVKICFQRGFELIKNYL